MLLEKRVQLEAVAQELLKREVLFQSDLERLIGKRPFNKDVPVIELNQPKVETDKVPENTGNLGSEPSSNTAN